MLSRQVRQADLLARRPLYDWSKIIVTAAALAIGWARLF